LRIAGLAVTRTGEGTVSLADNPNIRSGGGQCAGERQQPDPGAAAGLLKLLKRSTGTIDASNGQMAVDSLRVTNSGLPEATGGGVPGMGTGLEVEVLRGASW